jgi:YVTN family beta-propeller protein
VVGRYDVTSGAIDWISGSGANVTHMVVVMPGEKKIYTANIGSDSVSVLDLSNAPRAIALKQIAVGKGPEGIDLSPDGKEIWVSHRGDGGLSIIDTATDVVTQTLTIGTKMANRVKFTLDGKRVLISDPPSNLVLVYDAPSRQLVKKVDVEKGPEGILIAPDGKRAFVACSDAGKVVVLDLDSLNVTGSVATGNQPDGMAYSTR